MSLLFKTLAGYCDNPLVAGGAVGVAMPDETNTAHFSDDTRRVESFGFEDSLAVRDPHYLLKLAHDILDTDEDDNPYHSLKLLVASTCLTGFGLINFLVNKDSAGEQSKSNNGYSFTTTWADLFNNGLITGQAVILLAQGRARLKSAKTGWEYLDGAMSLMVGVADVVYAAAKSVEHIPAWNESEILAWSTKISGGISLHTFSTKFLALAVKNLYRAVCAARDGKNHRQYVYNFCQTLGAGIAETFLTIGFWELVATTISGPVAAGIFLFFNFSSFALKFGDHLYTRFYGGEGAS